MNEFTTGVKVVFNGNIYGVTPRIGTATIIEVSGGLGTHCNTNPDNVYKVKGENGNVFWIDERQIIGIVAL